MQILKKNPLPFVARESFILNQSEETNSKRVKSQQTVCKFYASHTATGEQILSQSIERSFWHLQPRQNKSTFLFDLTQKLGRNSVCLPLPRGETETSQIICEPNLQQLPYCKLYIYIQACAENVQQRGNQKMQRLNNFRLSPYVLKCKTDFKQN